MYVKVENRRENFTKCSIAKEKIALYCVTLKKIVFISMHDELTCHKMLQKTYVHVHFDMPDQGNGPVKINRWLPGTVETYKNKCFYTYRKFCWSSHLGTQMTFTSAKEMTIQLKL